MRLTARGVRNYQDKVVARQDKREQTIMDLYGKGGSAALRKIFNNSTVDNRGINLFKRKKKSADLDFSEIETDNLNPNLSNIFTQQDVSMDEQGYLELLRKQYNISDDAAARLIANGDPTIFQRIYEATKKKAEYYAEELGVEPPDSIVSNIVENSAIVPASPTGKLDIDKVEAYIGREMDSVMKAMIQSEGIQRGRVILGDTFLRKDLGPDKASPYIDEAVQYTLMYAQNANSRISDVLEQFRLIAQPVDQNTRGRTLTEKELIHQDFLMQYQQQLQDAIEHYEKNTIGGKGNPLRLFQLFGITGLLSEAERMPNLLNEPNVKKYVELYGGIAGKDARMVLRVPVFLDEQENVQAVLSQGYDRIASSVPPAQQSFLHQLLYGNIIHKDQVIQLIAGEDFNSEITAGMNLGNPFSKNKRF